MTGGVLRNSITRGSVFACLALLSATAGMAATSSSLWGVDYSEWFYNGNLAIDGSGELYVLSICSAAVLAPSCVIKVSADNKTMLWQRTLDDTMAAMAVDPAGNVYAVPALVNIYLPLGTFVEKISADGTTVLWKTSLGFNLSEAIEAQPLAIAIDSAGRAYAAGYDDTKGGYVVRLNAAGAVDYTASVADTPTSIAVDASGSAFVVGSRLTRLAPDGSAGFSVGLPPIAEFAVPPTVAVGANGGVVVHSSDSNENGILLGFNAQGAMTFTESVGAGDPQSGVATDATGNAYIAGANFGQWYPVRSSIATCGSAWLSVFAPDGSLLQTTYIPGAGPVWDGSLVTGPNSTVYALTGGDPSFSPSQSGPVAASFYPVLLTRFSPQDGVQTFPLACVANAATADVGPIAPGAIVTLTGNGLGPVQGIRTEATLQSPFPTQTGDAEVTFDGNPAPLLWVQDGQVNVVVPWSLTPGQTTQICVSYNSVKTNCLGWPVTQTTPGVFTVDGGYAAALNQDGTVNSSANPAKFGSIVAIFATGLGPINPPQADGSLVGLPLPVNTLPVAVTLAYCVESPFPPNGCEDPGPYPVSYAGPAPFLVAGASQVNFQANMQTGTSLQLVVKPQNGPPVLSNWFSLHVANQ